MKYNFPDTFAHICHNSGVTNIWVLDLFFSDFFTYTGDSVPKLSRIGDAQKMCIATAAQAIKDDNLGVCIYPSASTLLECMSSLYELNRIRVPMLVGCFVDDYDLAPENPLLPLLNGSDFFVQELTQPEHINKILIHTMQYALSQNKTGILLINRRFLYSEEKFDTDIRSRAHPTKPVIVPNERKAEELIGLLNNSQKITIVCGKKHSYNATNQINRLSLLLKAPVVYTPGMSSLIYNNVDYAAGIHSHWSDTPALDALSQCDTILLLDFQRDNLSGVYDSKNVIQITPFSLSGESNDKTKYVFRGNVADTLDLITPSVIRKSDSSFVDSIMEKTREANRRNADQEGPVPSVLHSLARLFNDNIDRSSCLCAEGYVAFFFLNKLVDKYSERFICNFESLMNEGNTVFMTIGMGASMGSPQSICILDSDAFDAKASSLLPLTNRRRNLKILAFNRNKDNMRLRDLCVSLGITYNTLNAEDILPGTQHWLNSPQSTVLEIFVDIPDGLLVENKYSRYDTVDENLMANICDSLSKTDTGIILYKERTFSYSMALKNSDNPNLQPLNYSRNLFYVACGAYCESRKISVCMAGGLSELLNMIPGILEAKRKLIPVVLIVFMPSKKWSRSVVKEIRIIKKVLFTLSCYTHIANKNRELESIFGEAIADAEQMQDISTVLFQNYEQFADVSADSTVYNTPHSVSLRYPDQSELSTLIEYINASSNPVIFAGKETEVAADLVRELSLRIKAPLGWTFYVKDLFDSDARYSIGIPGILSNRSVNYALKKADLVILLGIEFPFANYIHDNVTVIQLDSRYSNIGLSLSVNFAILADIRQSLELALPGIKEKESEQFALKCARMYVDEYDDYIREIEAKETRLQSIISEGVVDRINRNVPDNAWIVADMVVPWYLTAMIVKSRGTRRLFNTGDNVYSCNSSSFCLGASLINPQIPRVVITTNICIMKQIDSLWKIAEKNCNITIFVIHTHGEDPTVTFSNFIDPKNSIGMVIDSFVDLNQKIRLVAEMTGFNIVDIYTDRQTPVLSPGNLPVLVKKYRDRLEELYMNLDKEVYLQTFGVLPVELNE